MSVGRTASLAACLAGLRDHLGPDPLLPAKRRREDFSSDDDSDDDHLSLRMPRSSPEPADCHYHHHDYDDARSAPSSAAAAADADAAPLLHFFVRASSKTLVLHARADDTVKRLIALIARLTGMPAAEHRLIYRGRQLDDAATLADCGVQNDASLHLTGRLRSTRHPRAWQIANDLVSAVSSPNYNPAIIDPLIKEFLGLVPPRRSPVPAHETDEYSDYLQVFIMAGAPAALVKMYISPRQEDQIVANRAIDLFLNSNANSYLTQCIQTHCVHIVLEFCKLLGSTAGREDRLYISCRSTFGSLLEAQDARFFSRANTKTIRDLFPFVTELAMLVLGEVAKGTLSISGNGPRADAIRIPSFHVQEFSNFLLAMRRAIKEWLGGSGLITKLLYSGTHPQYEDWIGSLHSMFIELLKGVDHYLKAVGNILAREGMVQSESDWTAWSYILDVLTQTHVFSKIYEDGDELVHTVLLARQLPLNALLKQAKRNDKLHWLLKHKDVTNFEARQNLVLMLFPEGKDDYDELHEMLIDRSQLLEESFEYITQAEASALHGGLFMEFKNEDATGPGVLREWFCLLGRAIFNPQNVLFVPCPNDRRRFLPNPTSSVDPLHLKYFEFCGRIIALALMHKVQLGIVFDRVFFLQLAGKIVTLEDIKDADPCLYTNCKKVLEMDVELLDSDILGLTFVREIEELGTRRTVDLCPGGKDVVVNSCNREEYVNLLIQHRFVTCIYDQVAHFAQGFGDILSSIKLQKFFFRSLDLEDFDRMLGGSENDVSVRDWKAHTEYNGYRAKDRQICWFWKIVEGMSAEQKRVLLFFWTSVKFLPVDGFSGLASKLYIYKTPDSPDHLPTSHTCFYRLCLPPYPSISIMRDRLQFITQEHVSCSFGIW